MRARVPRSLTSAPTASSSCWDLPNKLGSLEWEGPRSGTGSLPPRPAEFRGLGRGGTVLPAPRPRRPRPRLPNALAAAATRTQALASQRRQL